MAPHPWPEALVAHARYISRLADVLAEKDSTPPHIVADVRATAADLSLLVPRITELLEAARGTDAAWKTFSPYLWIDAAGTPRFKGDDQAAIDHWQAVEDATSALSAALAKFEEPGT